MKVLAVVFTVRREKSSLTLQVAEEICREIRSVWGGDTETEIVTMSELPVQPCMGCKTCFLEGMCPQDRTDGMATLRQKMKECDALVVATPVYMITVSGWCKCFLDRCASYCHVFEFAGKPCLVISVTAMTGGQQAADYLSEMMEVMGCAVAAKLPLHQHDGHGLVIGSEAARDAVRSAVAALGDAAADPGKYVSERAEQQFAALRDVYRRLEVKWMLYGQKFTWEVSTFRERGYMNCEALKDALKEGCVENGREDPS